jgi:predicted double-glycine peptidase
MLVILDNSKLKCRPLVNIAYSLTPSSRGLQDETAQNATADKLPAKTQSAENWKSHLDQLKTNSSKAMAVTNPATAPVAAKTTTFERLRRVTITRGMPQSIAAEYAKMLISREKTPTSPR